MHSKQSKAWYGLVVAAGLLATLSLPVEAGPAGRVQFVNGAVSVVGVGAGGVTRTPKKGDVISEGEFINTGPDGNMQIRMNDDGIVAVRPNTRLRIDIFQYQGKQDGSENSVFSLLKGGFRAITGAVGRLNKDKYSVQTPTATIGIRGTDHEPFFIPEGSTEFGSAPAGTYDKVNVGQARIQTAAGMVDINPNQVGFAAGVGSRPALLPSVPAFFRATSQTSQSKSKASGQQQGEVAAVEAPAEQQAASQTATQRPTVATVEGLDGVRIDLTSQRATDNAGNPIDLNGQPLAGGVLAGALIDKQSDNRQGAGAGSADGARVRLGADGGLVAISDGIDRQLTRGSALLADRGGNLLNVGGVAIPVEWGRWDQTPPDHVFDSTRSGLDNDHLGSLHYIYGPSLTPAGKLDATSFGAAAGRYSLVGGTHPTSQRAGEAGRLEDMQMVVNFSAQRIDGYALKLSFGERVFRAINAEKVRLTPRFEFGLIGKCTGCGTNEDLIGKAAGGFVGPTANGVLTSYGLNSLGSVERAVGTALLGMAETYTTPPELPPLPTTPIPPEPEPPEPPEPPVPPCRLPPRSW
ncbi:hypothetical protein FNU76_11775 [Chitinimonas arctica]|uniref:FecR protein domain-containing protein n=1 Tax=Chitinimonas arctica TaxID=2594795 RepID=A0A516SFP3_9NEIS|nr:FecR domain-containing protein [Chitinimonas arctica]QDQ26986.1 hypothetical protein FNU76_11775 [Chitinimonas arctica]